MSLILPMLAAMDASNASDLFLTEGKAPAARIHGVVREIGATLLAPADFAAF